MARSGDCMDRIRSGRLFGVGLASLALVITGISVATAPAASAASATFTSTQIGSSGNTPQFSESGNWTMSWSYSCAAYGQAGNFSVIVNQPANDTTIDIGPNELGSGGSGTDSYTDTGVFSLSITSECDWSISVSRSSAPPTVGSVTYTSTQIGSSGNTPQFSESGNWTMSWSYSCAAYGQAGNFSVIVNQPANDTTIDIGPNELGSGGSGTDSYTDTGVFSLSITSECDWSISVTGAGGSATPPPTLAGPVVGMAALPNGQGYWVVNAAGQVDAHGAAVNYGQITGPLNAPISHIVSTPDGLGYWLVAADGGVFAFGNAQFYGSMGGKPLNAPVMDIIPTSNGQGYWLVATDGGVFAFGNAQFYGSMGGHPLNAPVNGGSFAQGGYRMVANDGGIFDFGGAQFYGSMGGKPLNQPIVGMADTPNGQGYWGVASDGGIFAFGNASFYGSMGGKPLNKPIVGMASDPATGGYWLVASDGGIFSFNAPFFGAD